MNHISIDATHELGQISRHIYGHFAEHLGRCIYDGLWVGDSAAIANTRGLHNEVLGLLRRIRIPNLRWPGGCFADDYHWQDGIGPRAQRPRRINRHWGRVIETNAFGTHEFLDLCEQLDCEPYICGNVGSGTVREMADWFEYLTHPGGSTLTDLRRENGRETPWTVPWWGVGNENWGCGGHMRPEYYADLYRQYASYLHAFTDAPLYKVACGPNDWNTNWTRVMMREVGWRMNGLSLHYYFGTGKHSRSATRFDAEDWAHLLHNTWRLDECIRRHEAIMDETDEAANVALVVDEWGTWHDVEPGTHPGFLYQQNTMRDAVCAGLALNIFNRHCRRVRMANIAQTVNVLQAVLLTEGAAVVTTPTYHVFDLYQVHHDATALRVGVTCDLYGNAPHLHPVLDASASRDAQGHIHLTVCNLHHDTAQELVCDVRGAAYRGTHGRLLTAPMTAHNTVADRAAVAPQPFPGLAMRDGLLRAALPPRSVAVLQFAPTTAEQP